MEVKITFFMVFKKHNQSISFIQWIRKNLNHLFFLRIIALGVLLLTVVKRRRIAAKNLKKETVVKCAQEGNDIIYK